MIVIKPYESLCWKNNDPFYVKCMIMYYYMPKYKLWCRDNNIGVYFDGCDIIFMEESDATAFRLVFGV